MADGTYHPRGEHPFPTREGTGSEVAGNPARLIVPTNTNRRGVTLRNLGAEGENAYIGFTANVTSEDGLLLAPGESIPIGDTPQPIYAYSEAASPEINWIET